MIIVQAVPYKSFKERVKIVSELEKKGYRIEIYSNFIYGEKGKNDVWVF